MTNTGKLYYSIREVSERTGVKPHVLRYWETQFSMLRPHKGAGGNRRYRPNDVALVETIQDLLHAKGFTIAGARKLLNARMRGRAVDLPDGVPPLREGGVREPREALGEIRAGLERIRQRLRADTDS
ncbi:MAG: MerR family transcriptional regulator [Candidatus Eisenbacteria bacterium]|nr:MerR family transcriptional regulator [Candidatus Eisenbacteria bacterium]